MDIQAKSRETVPLAWMFYSGFIVIAVFVVINLFIAVVIDDLEAAKVDVATEEQDVNDGGLLRQSAALRQRLAELERLLRERAHAGGLAEPRRAG